MATAEFSRARRKAPPGRGGALALPFAIGGFAAFAIAFVGYVLWPRWPAVAPDAPALPIVVAGLAFNVPPAAMRVPVQRRAGIHERVDLAFLWPSLDPPDPNGLAPPPGSARAAARTLDRIFLTISAASETLPPVERLKSIYPHYTAPEPIAGPEGLAVLAFREGTPYQGEDLIYDLAAPERFLLRCTRDNKGPTPGTCLYSKRIGSADLVARFPRDWLADWRFVEITLERLIGMLQPSERTRR